MYLPLDISGLLAFLRTLQVASARESKRSEVLLQKADQDQAEKARKKSSHVVSLPGPQVFIYFYYRFLLILGF